MINFSCNFSKKNSSVVNNSDTAFITVDNKSLNREDTLTYYSYGIAILDPIICSELLGRYNVKVINTNCVLNSDDMDNNMRVDRIVYKENGISVTGYIFQRKNRPLT
jgi:hypothetical protein